MFTSSLAFARELETGTALATWLRRRSEKMERRGCLATGGKGAGGLPRKKNFAPPFPLHECPSIGSLLPAQLHMDGGHETALVTGS
jgi:hypothetical protein